MPTSTSELISEVYRITNGELDSTITPSMEDGQTILSIINQMVDSYYNAVDQFGDRIVWIRNVDPSYVLGEADGMATEFEIDWNEIDSLPDGFYIPIRIGKVKYDLVPLWELWSPENENKTVCSISANGLTFNEAPEQGDILFPGCIRGRKLTGSERDVEAATLVHGVHWLKLASAAEYVRTDMVRGAQYPNVLAQANDAFMRLYRDNEARTTPLKYRSVGNVAMDYSTPWAW